MNDAHQHAIFLGARTTTDGDLSVKKVLSPIVCVDAGTQPVSASVLQQHCKVAKLVFY